MTISNPEIPINFKSRDWDLKWIPGSRDCFSGLQALGSTMLNWVQMDTNYLRCILICCLFSFIFHYSKHEGFSQRFSFTFIKAIVVLLGQSTVFVSQMGSGFHVTCRRYWILQFNLSVFSVFGGKFWVPVYFQVLNI